MSKLTKSEIKEMQDDRTLVLIKALLDNEIIDVHGDKDLAAKLLYGSQTYACLMNPNLDMYFRAEESLKELLRLELTGNMTLWRLRVH